MSTENVSKKKNKFDSIAFNKAFNEFIANELKVDITQTVLGPIKYQSLEEFFGAKEQLLADFLKTDIGKVYANEKDIEKEVKMSRDSIMRVLLCTQREIINDYASFTAALKETKLWSGKKFKIPYKIIQSMLHCIKLQPGEEELSSFLRTHNKKNMDLNRTLAQLSNVLDDIKSEIDTKETRQDEQNVFFDGITDLLLWSTQFTVNRKCESDKLLAKNRFFQIVKQVFECANNYGILDNDFANKMLKWLYTNWRFFHPQSMITGTDKNEIVPDGTSRDIKSVQELLCVLKSKTNESYLKYLESFLTSLEQKNSKRDDFLSDIKKLKSEVVALNNDLAKNSQNSTTENNIAKNNTRSLDSKIKQLGDKVAYINFKSEVKSLTYKINKINKINTLKLNGKLLEKAKQLSGGITQLNNQIKKLNESNYKQFKNLGAIFGQLRDRYMQLEVENRAERLDNKVNKLDLSKAANGEIKRLQEEVKGLVNEANKPNKNESNKEHIEDLQTKVKEIGDKINKLAEKEQINIVVSLPIKSQKELINNLKALNGNDEQQRNEAMTQWNNIENGKYLWFNELDIAHLLEDGMIADNVLVDIDEIFQYLIGDHQKNLFKRLLSLINDDLKNNYQEIVYAKKSFSDNALGNMKTIFNFDLQKERLDAKKYNNINEFFEYFDSVLSSPDTAKFLVEWVKENFKGQTISWNTFKDRVLSVDEPVLTFDILKQLHGIVTFSSQNEKIDFDEVYIFMNTHSRFITSVETLNDMLSVFDFQNHKSEDSKIDSFGVSDFMAYGFIKNMNELNHVLNIFHFVKDENGLIEQRPGFNIINCLANNSIMTIDELKDLTSKLKLEREQNSNKVIFSEIARLLSEGFITDNNIEALKEIVDFGQKEKIRWDLISAHLHPDLLKDVDSLKQLRDRIDPEQNKIPWHMIVSFLPQNFVTNVAELRHMKEVIDFSSDSAETLKLKLNCPLCTKGYFKSFNQLDAYLLVNSFSDIRNNMEFGDIEHLLARNSIAKFDTLKDMVKTKNFISQVQDFSIFKPGAFKDYNVNDKAVCKELGLEYKSTGLYVFFALIGLPLLFPTIICGIKAYLAYCFNCELDRIKAPIIKNQQEFQKQKQAEQTNSPQKENQIENTVAKVKPIKPVNYVNKENINPNIQTVTSNSKANLANKKIIPIKGPVPKQEVITTETEEKNQNQNADDIKTSQ